MKKVAGLLILFSLIGCSDPDHPANREPVADQIERYSKPIDAAGAAADQVQQIRDQ